MPVETQAVLKSRQQSDAAELVLQAGRPDSGLRASSRASTVRWLEANALFIAAVTAVIVVSLAAIPTHLAQDGWLALVAGRIVAHSGIPYHDYLTVMAHGVRWNDQQWLAQLVMYGLWAIGGLQLLTVLYVLITGIAFAMAIAAARALGAEDRHVTAMLPLGAFFYLATAVSIRTQGFAYPLFVGTLWVLALDVRRPTRRAYLVFPMLILWANLHGSATLGAGLVGLYGVCRLGGRFAQVRWRGLLDLRGWAFVIGAPACLLVTPYGLSIISYYKGTLFNSEFSKLITEWQPVTSYMILAVPLLLLIGATIWMLGRSGRRTPAFDQILLGILAFGAVDAVRNITWFGLAVVILLPPTITMVRVRKAAAPRRERVNLTLSLGAVALTAIMVAGTLAHSSSWFERTYPTRAMAVVRQIMTHQPEARIFADVRFSDWLIWHDPSLAGHIAYDTSFENLSLKQLQTLTTLAAARLPGQHDPLAQYSVLVLYPKNKSSNRILLWRSHAHVVLRTKRVLIATKTPS
jgi:hypothetical protein